MLTTSTPSWAIMCIFVMSLIHTVLPCPGGGCECKGNVVKCKFSDRDKFPEKIPSSVTSLTLESMKMTDQNNFGDIVRGNFSGFKQLEEITLIRCGVTGIGSGAFVDLTKLKSLTLKYNTIVSIHPGSFTLAQNHILQTLIMSSNGLKTIQDFTFRGVNIETLDLSNNAIETINDRAFFEASVKTLNLSHNELTALGGDSLRPLAGSLTSLDLSRNGMKTLDAETLPVLTKLTDVNLSGNMIREVTPDMLQPLTSLKSLNLGHNALFGLKEGFLAIIDKVDAINIDENPFNCNCELKWLQTHAEPNQTCQQKKKCFSKVRCATPRDTLLSAFPEADFKCSPVKMLSPIVKLTEATCRAQGDPAPLIWWQAPSGAVVPAATVSYGATSTNSTIKITLDSEIGSYKCVAGNSLGNASEIVRDVGTCRSRNVCYGPGDIAGAVLGTFCFCVILGVLLYLFRNKICKRREARKKPVPRFKNNVYRDITSPVGKSSRENERL